MRILSFTVLACALSLAACGGSSPQPQVPPPTTADAQSAPAPMADHHEHGEHGEHGHSHAAAGGAVKPIGEASVGDTTKCPVSGEEFVVAADSPKAEHEGKTYYFCCAGCKKKFESDPKKFSSAK